MKNKIFKFISSAFFSAFILSTLSAFAANDISVKIDDKKVKFTDVKPIIENSRTFVPFRAIFEQMNAEVSWDSQTRTITAVRGDTEVKFTIGRQDVTITENGISQTRVIDAAPFIKDSRTYVPIRFASEAFGACVDWENDTRTVLIVDVDNFLDEYKNKFSNIQKYIDFSKENVALSGSFTNYIKYKTAMGIIPINTSGTLNGTKNNSDFELSGSAYTDINAIKSAITENENKNAIDSEIQNMLNHLANGSCSAIVSDNKLYLSGSVFMPLGLEKGTWACISEFNTLSFGDNFMDYLAASVQNVKLSSNPNNTVSVVKNYLDSMKNIYGDESFVQNEDAGSSLNNSAISLTLTFDENKNISDAVFSENKTENGINISVYSHSNRENLDFKLNMTGGKTLDISFNFTAMKSDTTSKPATVPNGDVFDISLNY